MTANVEDFALSIERMEGGQLWIWKSQTRQGILWRRWRKNLARAQASTVFSEPIEREGITVIPVAKTRWAFGGGAGHRKDEDGAGGGGAVQVAPVGFIEIKNGQAEFRPIRTLSMPLMILGGISTILLLRRLKRLL
ncbi:MAG TPA: spore germination protein GerW family protein [Pyrinomonadaceae bacterium]|nr:spore germination protein GerW family protein [Pyrinomonadaceae bacterium]